MGILNYLKKLLTLNNKNTKKNDIIYSKHTVYRTPAEKFESDAPKLNISPTVQTINTTQNYLKRVDYLKSIDAIAYYNNIISQIRLKNSDTHRESNDQIHKKSVIYIKQIKE